jgi:hypothetical protein
MLILAVETSTFTGSVALVEAAVEAGASPRLRVIGETTLQVSVRQARSDGSEMS